MILGFNIVPGTNQVQWKSAVLSDYQRFKNTSQADYSADKASFSSEKGCPFTESGTSGSGRHGNHKHLECQGVKKTG